jgi:hypothetical protein
MSFVIADHKRNVDRKCRNPITLEGLPFMTGRLCGFFADFGDSLQVGGEIMVFGRGTRHGVFVDSAARLNPDTDGLRERRPEDA